MVTQPSNEDSELVGDTDGQGFGIGMVSTLLSHWMILILFLSLQAPITAKQSISPVAATKKWRSKAKKQRYQVDKYNFVMSYIIENCHNITHVWFHNSNIIYAYKLDGL